MNKSFKIIVSLSVLSLTSCGLFSKNSSEVSSSEDISTNSTSSGTTFKEKTYDEFYNQPGEFFTFPVLRTDTFDNNALYDGYYASLSSWENGRELKKKLFSIIYNPDVYVANTYEGNWNTNKNADEALEELDTVNVLYNVNNQNKNDTYSSSNTKGWNREHAFCASLLTGSITATAVKTKGIATDFHNLFAANSGGNSSRSDKNLGVVTPEEDTSKNFATSTRPGYDYRFTPDRFEPNDTDKGMLSRAILYMSVMYGKDEWNNNPYKVGDGVYLRENTCTISDTDHCIGNSSTLVDWSNQFLVSREEYKHNMFVESEQHNRNPFVDFINLADYVYGNKRNSKGNINDLISSYAYLNIDKDEVNNLAVENNVKEFAVGDIFSSESLNVYEIKNDFTKNLINEYQVKIDDELVTLPYTFDNDDMGEKTVKVIANSQETSYKIEVKSQGMKSCSHYHGFDSYITSNKTDSSSRDEIKNKTFTVNGVKWNVSFNNCSPDEASVIGSIANDGTYGVKVCTTTKYCSSLVLETETVVNNIDQVMFKGATAADTNESIQYQLLTSEGTVIKSSVSPISRDKVESSFNLETPTSGKIRILFTNANHKAIYLTALAFNVVSD